MLCCIGRCLLLFIPTKHYLATTARTSPDVLLALEEQSAELGYPHRNEASCDCIHTYTLLRMYPTKRVIYTSLQDVESFAHTVLNSVEKRRPGEVEIPDTADHGYKKNV